jgi:phage recombination protein Bet
MPVSEEAKQKRQETIARKKQVEETENKLATIAQAMPDEWADTEEMKLSLIKSMHKDVLGKDRDGSLRPLADLRYFMFQAAQRNLNPFKNQLHAVYIWDSQIGGEKLIPITGIDGFTTIAQRTNRYAGMSETRFEFDATTGLPIKAVVDIYAYNPVTGAREIVTTATAWWDEYARYKEVWDWTTENGKRVKRPTGERELNSTWKNRPKGQLEKCAQALGLRRSFPEELSGLYVRQEVDRLQEIPANSEPEMIQSDEEKINAALAARQQGKEVEAVNGSDEG